jgi:ArsR family transcriptional regulator
MDEKQQMVCKDVARLVKYLSHPTRLEIVCVLKDSEQCVKEICRILNKRQSNISQHLSLLRHAGFIDLKRIGNTSNYFITSPKIIKVLKILAEG